MSWNALINQYYKIGQLRVAHKLFECMGHTRNFVTLKTLMCGYLHQRGFGIVISLFREMEIENIKPTKVTMSTLLSVCGHLGTFKYG